MGIKIAGINVSKIIKVEVGDKMLKETEHDVILTVFTRGTRTGNNTGGTNPTSTTHTAKGFIDSTDIKSVKGTLVEAGDFVIQVVGDSISVAVVPKVDDQLNIESNQFIIKVIDRDPAAAMYTCICREV